MTCEENHISHTPSGFQGNRHRPELRVLQVTETPYPARPFCLICLLCHLEGNVLKANISSASQPNTPSRKEVVLDAHLWHWGLKCWMPKSCQNNRQGRKINKQSKKNKSTITRSKTDGQEGLLWCYIST